MAEPTKEEIIDALQYIQYIGALVLILGGAFANYGIVHAFGEETANKVLSVEIGIVGIISAIAIALEQKQASSVGRE